MKPIVILAGQSNMVGHGELSALDHADMPSGVNLFDLNPRDGCFGPEYGFAREIQKRSRFDDLWLVKYAVGGSSLLAWEPDWSAERAAITDDADKGPLYERLIRHFERTTQGEEVEVLACLWMQGERDARYKVAAAQYQSNLTRLIARTRNDLNQPDMAFILGLAYPPAQRYNYRSVVREAQRNVVAGVKNVHVVETAGLSKHDDELHFDTAGQLELGRRFADQLLRLLTRVRRE